MNLGGFVFSKKLHMHRNKNASTYKSITKIENL